MNCVNSRYMNYVDFQYSELRCGSNAGRITEIHYITRPTSLPCADVTVYTIQLLL